MPLIFVVHHALVYLRTQRARAAVLIELLSRSWQASGVSRCFDDGYLTGCGIRHLLQILHLLRQIWLLVHYGAGCISQIIIIVRARVWVDAVGDNSVSRRPKVCLTTSSTIIQSTPVGLIVLVDLIILNAQSLLWRLGLKARLELIKCLSIICCIRSMSLLHLRCLAFEGIALILDAHLRRLIIVLVLNITSKGAVNHVDAVIQIWLRDKIRLCLGRSFIVCVLHLLNQSIACHVVFGLEVFIHAYVMIYYLFLCKIPAFDVLAGSRQTCRILYFLHLLFSLCWHSF